MPKKGDPKGAKTAKSLGLSIDELTMQPCNAGGKDMGCFNAETFEAKGDCAECYGTGGLYDSHMGINDECHSCGGTGFDY